MNDITQEHEMRLMSTRPDGQHLYSCLLCPARVVARDKKDALEKALLMGNCIKEQEEIEESDENE